jgi:hypothetical protein
LYGNDPTMGGQPAPEPADDEDPWQMVMEAVRAAVQADGQVTAQEELIAEQITTLIAKLRAGREKEEQAALGGGPATQYLKRASGA